VTPGNTYTVVVGSGGVGGIVNGIQAASGANGAVRIVWPATTRTFPSTNVSSTTNELVN
jgi:hypothetical protein